MRKESRKTSTLLKDIENSLNNISKDEMTFHHLISDLCDYAEGIQSKFLSVHLHLPIKVDNTTLSIIIERYSKPVMTWKGVTFHFTEDTQNEGVYSYEDSILGILDIYYTYSERTQYSDASPNAKEQTIEVFEGINSVIHVTSKQEIKHILDADYIAQFKSEIEKEVFNA